jgi:peptidoglycan-associated lipoprotein
MNGFFMLMRSVLVVALVAGVAASAGCSKKPKPATDVTQVPPSSPATPSNPPSEPSPPTDEGAGVGEIEDVFFDYDRYNLRDDARRTLDANAKVLLADKSARLLLEGHCDERGTVEYNLALGERRAQSARSYLIEFGVEQNRLSTISYGEERPFSQGHGEEAWSQNRRVHFVKQ